MKLSAVKADATRDFKYLYKSNWLQIDGVLFSFELAYSIMYPTACACDTLHSTHLVHSLSLTLPLNKTGIHGHASCGSWSTTLKTVYSIACDMTGTFVLHVC